MKFKEESLNKIADYYESETNRVWDIIGNGHIHLGYWDKDNLEGSFGDGTEKLTRIMIDKANIKNGELFCDLGCGMGMPAIQLAKAKKCYIHGVTLCQYQQIEAKKRAKQYDTEDLTNFTVANVLDLPFEDSSYDGGWFFESIFHMGHEQALKEAYRLLKPGATLLIADVTDIGVSTEAEKKFAKESLNASFITKDDYPVLLEKTGFELVELNDVTEQVMELFESKLARAVKEHQRALLQIVDQTFLDQFSIIGREMKRYSGYVIVSARKPL